MLSRTVLSQDPLAVCVLLSLGLHSLIVGSAVLRQQPQANDDPVMVAYVIEPSASMPASASAALEARQEAPAERADTPGSEQLKPRADPAPRQRQRPPRSGQHANAPPNAAPQEVPAPRSPTAPGAGHSPNLMHAYSDIVWRHLAAAARTYSPAETYEVAPNGITAEVQLHIDADGQLVGVDYAEEAMLLTRQDSNFRRFLDSANPFPIPPGRRPAAVRVRLQIANLPG